MGGLGAPELILVVGAIVLLFGTKKLPEFARSLGKAKQEFKNGLDEEPAARSADARVKAVEAGAKAEVADAKAQVAETRAEVAIAEAQAEPAAEKPAVPLR